MIYSREFYILRLHNVSGKISTMLYIDEIACAMHDQRGHSNCRKHVSNIDAVVHAHEGLSGAWAGACSFRAPNKFAQLFVASQAWHEPID